MADRNISGWLPNLLGPVDFEVEGTPTSVPRRGKINIIGGTVADDPDNERTNVTVGGGGGGGGAPGTPDKSLQRKNGSAFAGMEYFLRESFGRLNVERHHMTGAPSLDFASTTITRGFGSWVTDGFVAGDVIQIKGSASNDGSRIVTAVSASVLTVSVAFTTESAMAGIIDIEAGGYLSTGLAGATLPVFGLIRLPQPTADDPDRVVLAIVDRSTGKSVALLSTTQAAELGIGGTWQQAGRAGGNVDVPINVGLWGEVLHLRPGKVRWGDDNGHIFGELLWGQVRTTDATPTTLTVPSGVIVPGLIEITLRAQSNTGLAFWRWESLPSGAVQTHHDYSGGSSATWTAALSGNIACTGAAFTDIEWTLNMRLL